MVCLLLCKIAIARGSVTTAGNSTVPPLQLSNSKCSRWVMMDEAAPSKTATTTDNSTIHVRPPWFGLVPTSPTDGCLVWLGFGEFAGPVEALNSSSGSSGHWTNPNPNPYPHLCHRGGMLPCERRSMLFTCYSWNTIKPFSCCKVFCFAPSLSNQHQMCIFLIQVCSRELPSESSSL